jgi:hypothetical protein
MTALGPITSEISPDPGKTKSTPNEIRIGNFGTGSDTDAVQPQKSTFFFARR